MPTSSRCKVVFEDCKYEQLVEQDPDSDSVRLLKRAWDISREISEGHTHRLVRCYCLLSCEAYNDAGTCLDVFYVLASTQQAVPNSAQGLAGDPDNGYLQTLQVPQLTAETRSVCVRPEPTACRSSVRTTCLTSAWWTWSAGGTCTMSTPWWSRPRISEPSFGNWLAAA